MIQVKLFTLLRVYLGEDEVQIDADELDVRTLLHKVAEQTASNVVIDKLLEPDGSMRVGTIVMVNGKDVLELDRLDTPVRNGDSVSLFPPGGGG